MTTATRTTSTRTAYRGCPLCEAGCGLEITLRREAGSEPWDEEVVRIRGDRDDVFSHGFICPKGSTLKQLHEDPDRLRTPAGAARRRSSCRPPGTRRSPRSSGACCPIIEEHGRDAVGVYLGNPNVHNRRQPALRPRPPEGARHRQRLLGEHRRPDAEAGLGRPDVRAPAQRPGARPRPHRLPAHARRQPVRVERQPRDRARLARPARRASARAAARSSSSTRAARGPPRRPTSTSPSGPGTDAHFLFAIVHTLFAEGLVDLGTLAELRRRASTRSSGSRATSPPRRVAPIVRHRRRRRSAASPASSPRAERAVVYGRIGTMHAGVRHARELARRRAATCSPATSTGPAARCSRRAALGAANTRGAPGVRAGASRSGAARAACAGCPSRSASCRSCAWRRRSTTPGEGQIRALDHDRRQPGALDPERRRARRRARLARLHGVGRHLPQRDDPPRRRDPPVAEPAREEPLRPRASPARGAQRRQLLAARPPARPRRARRVGACWRSSALDRAGPRGRRRPGARRRPRDPQPRRDGGRRRALPVDGRDPDEMLDALAPRVGPGADPRLHAAHRSVRRRVRRARARGWPDARPAARAPPRHRPRRARAARCPRSCARRAGKVELAPEVLVADTGSAAHVPRPRPTTGSCSSAAATCAPTTRGCTTSTCS